MADETSAINQSQPSAYQKLRDEHHPHCFVCAQNNGHGLHLAFQIVCDGTVEASFPCDEPFEGLPGMVHGGIVSALLDGAMTNCLLAHGRVCVTYELNIRYRHPVVTGKPATVRARLVSSSEPIHEMAAELIQDGKVRATAKAKFLDKAAGGLFGKTS